MTIENYALVDNKGIIVNIVVWDGDVNTWNPGKGITAIPCGDSTCEIGGTYKNGKFDRPPLPDPTQEEYAASSETIKIYLMDEATKKIAPLQDASDLDMATEDEKKELAEWRKYRVLLNRVDTSTAQKITWPEHP